MAPSRREQTGGFCHSSDARPEILTPPLENRLFAPESSYLDTARFDDLLRHRELFGEKREDGFAGFGGNPVGVGPRSHSCSQPMSNAHADADPAAPLAPTERKPSCLPGLPVRQRSLEGQ